MTIETSCETIARAKINLTLEVRGRRADGYHEIASLVAFADIGDRVTRDPARPAGINAMGPFAAAIEGENLAAVALRRVLAVQPGLAAGYFTIDKQLPVASGIGGGSADAAAVLRLIRAANPELSGAIAWAEIAAGLGADVPICLARRTAWITGAGAGITPVTGMPRVPAVLVNALGPVPSAKTATVFRRLDAGAVASGERPALPALFANRTELIGYVSARANDLEAPARELMPVIGCVLATLASCRGAAVARQSGAGPTCFALFEREDAAAAAAKRLTSEHPDWWVRQTKIG